MESGQKLMPGHGSGWNLCRIWVLNRATSAAYEVPSFPGTAVELKPEQVPGSNWVPVSLERDYLFV
jgi:hypothetical protein